jgi:hypothetical protein
MKKLIFMSIILLSSIALKAQDQKTIASWSFDKWLGGGAAGVPAGQSLYDVILPDSGTQTGTAKLGTEQMFDPIYNPVTNPVVRKWSAPSKEGYTRCNTGWLTLDGTERFFQISFSTTGLFDITINSSHATSGTTSPYQHSFTVQYRIGDGPWTNFTPQKKFDVTQVSETGINFGQVTDLKLPAEAAGKVGVDVRWLFGPPIFVTTNTDPNALTNWQTAWNTGSQLRLDNISVKGYQVATAATIFNSYGDIDFGEITKGQSKSDTIHILASKVSGNLTATTSAPFSLNKTSIAGTFNEFNTDLIVTFAPTAEGVFEKDFTLSGTGVTKTVKLKGVAIITGLNSIKNELEYVTGYRGILKINSPETQFVSVYDIMGRVVDKRQVEKGITTIPLEQGKLYIVIIGNNSKKIVL